MGFDLAGTTLAGSSGSLVGTYGGNQVMKMGTTGALQRSSVGHPMFRAGGSGTPADAGLGTNGWVAIVFGATSVNIGSCYNTGNGRFTAPVTSIYLVTASTYFRQNNGYSHPMFWVNGSSTLRRPSASGLHRMRAHGDTSGYQADTDAMEIISLIAGDYVNFYNYCGGYLDYVPQYSRFEGYLLG